MSYNSAALRPLVLVAEADSKSLERYVEWLVRSGLHVITAGTAEEAFGKALTLRPDIIQTNVNAGGRLDGCDLVRKLRDDGRTRAMPVIGVTEGKRDSVTRAREAGCDSVLVNPDSREAVLAALDALLACAAAPPKRF